MLNTDCSRTTSESSSSSSSGSESSVDAIANLVIPDVLNAVARDITTETEIESNALIHAFFSKDSTISEWLMFKYMVFYDELLNDMYKIHEDFDSDTEVTQPSTEPPQQMSSCLKTGLRPKQKISFDPVPILRNFSISKEPNRRISKKYKRHSNNKFICDEMRKRGELRPKRPPRASAMTQMEERATPLVEELTTPLCATTQGQKRIIVQENPSTSTRVDSDQAKSKRVDGEYPSTSTRVNSENTATGTRVDGEYPTTSTRVDSDPSTSTHVDSEYPSTSTIVDSSTSTPDKEAVELVPFNIEVASFQHQADFLRVILERGEDIAALDTRWKPKAYFKRLARRIVRPVARAASRVFMVCLNRCED